MKLKIGIETEEIEGIDTIQLSKGTDDKWRLYVGKGNKWRHFNLDKVLKNQEIRPESIEAFVASSGKTMFQDEIVNKQRILELIPGRGARARADCEKKDCVHYGGLGCHGCDDPMNQTCCRLDLNKATKCLNGSDYPLYKTMDDTSYDDYVEYYKKNFPMLTPPASAQERVRKAIQDKIDA